MKQHTRMNFVNGGLFVGLAAFSAINLGITGDEAAKFIPAEVLFYLKLSTATVLASLLALKTFLSQMKQENPTGKPGDTIYLSKP